MMCELSQYLTRNMTWMAFLRATRPTLPPCPGLETSYTGNSVRLTSSSSLEEARHGLVQDVQRLPWDDSRACTLLPSALLMATQATIEAHHFLL